MVANVKSIKDLSYCMLADRNGFYVAGFTLKLKKKKSYTEKKNLLLIKITYNEFIS